MFHVHRIFSLFLLCVCLLPSWALAQPSPLSPPKQSFTPDTAYLADRENLDALQRDAFLYMWEHSHPTSGMVYEATFHWDVTPVATGATGFGVAALITAADRGWVTREQALQRLMKISIFLRDKTARKELHGAFPHWINGETGATLPFSDNDTGADIVETSLLLQGLLLARQYFNGPGVEAELRAIITEIWHDVDWNWYTNGEEKGIYWHWSQQKGFSHSLRILGNNECLITYILALASPTHPISRKNYDYWTSGKGYQPKTVYGYRIEASLAGAGPLFLAQYSFIGLDPRRMADAYVKEGYFVRNIKHTLSNRGYSLLTSPASNKYSPRYWGLTASKVKNGYAANEPRKDRATVAPTAALSSLPYTPHYSLEVLDALRNEFKEKMWGRWGPYDAFSLRYKWYSPDYLGINQLPMVSMAENYRTGLFWRIFMQDSDILRGLQKADIHEPKHATGFPEVVRALKWKSNRYYEDAYDIRRHPDTGLYHVPYWVETKGSVSFLLLDAEQQPFLEQHFIAHEGRNIFTFTQHASKPTKAFTLIFTTETGEKHTLPIRLH